MKKVLVLATLMVFLMAGAAQAEYLLLENSGADLTSVGIHDPSGSVSTTAGRFTVDFGPSAGNYSVYQAFCVDYANVGWNTPYNSYFMIDVPNALAYKRAAYIFENFGFINPSAAQLAIWEVVFEGLSGSGPAATAAALTSQGVFYVPGLSGAELTDAIAYVQAAIDNAGGFDTSGYKLLVSPTATGTYYGANEQDWLVKVSEPITMILFGLGLLGVAGLRRKE